MNVNLPLLGERSSESLDLPAFDEEKHEEKQEWQRRDHTRRRRTCYTRCFQSLAVIFPWTATIALSVYIVLTKTGGFNRFQQTMLFPSQMTYSPAQSEIEYVVRTFDHNLVNSPVEFQNPDTVDAAWADLYDVGGASALELEEARSAPNETIEVLHNQSQGYMVQLDVFHQLHCLDIVRQSLEPFYGLKNDSLARLEANGGKRQWKQLPKRQLQETDPRPWRLIGNIKHLNHCLNTLRQSLMCHSDISVNVWQWFDPPQDLDDPFGELNPGTYPATNIAHTCRNFDKIKSWARSRQMRTQPDFSAKPVVNDFKIPQWP